MTTVTQWFPPAVTPVHVGAYQVSALFDAKYAWWNGSKWFVPHSSPEGAMGCAGFDTPLQSRFWRGLAEKPQEAA